MERSEEATRREREEDRIEKRPTRLGSALRLVPVSVDEKRYQSQLRAEAASNTWASPGLHVAEGGRLGSSLTTNKRRECRTQTRIGTKQLTSPTPRPAMTRPGTGGRVSESELGK